MAIPSHASDPRVFRLGTVLGGLALLAAQGAFKNVMAIFSGEREGYVLFGYYRRHRMVSLPQPRSIRSRPKEF